jgi:hypothetical protein
MTTTITIVSQRRRRNFFIDPRLLGVVTIDVFGSGSRAARGLAGLATWRSTALASGESATLASGESATLAGVAVTPAGETREGAGVDDALTSG